MEGVRVLRIAVLPNAEKTEALALIKRIMCFFEDKPVKIMLPMDIARFYNLDDYGIFRIDEEPTDLALSIGGDGTLLGVCRRYDTKGVPVCGINIGTLGFLADIETDELEIKLAKILSGDYRIEKRLLLSAYVLSGEEKKLIGHAINDVVVTKDGVARMVSLGLSINDMKLADFRSDGVIVSTPTGSTAYSMSAGGPLMNPNIQALLVTPICAHSFFMRPIVIGENDRVHIVIDSLQHDIIVTFDGQYSVRLLPGDSVLDKTSKHQAGIVKFDDKDYYETIKSKLWKNKDRS